jgi:hypothetical protein
MRLAVALWGAAVVVASVLVPAQREVSRHHPHGFQVSVAGAQTGAITGTTTSLPRPFSSEGLSIQPDTCGLLHPASDTATSSTCLTCHSRHSSGGHPYDVVHPRLGSGVGARVIRPIAQVLQRGLILPDGEIRCITCHDRNSPWMYHIRLPPGTRPTHAVDVRRPATYENPGALPPLKPGDDVGKKPLCLVCHALD